MDDWTDPHAAWYDEPLLFLPAGYRPTWALPDVPREVRDRWRELYREWERRQEHRRIVAAGRMALQREAAEVEALNAGPLWAALIEAVANRCTVEGGPDDRTPDR